MMRKLYKWDILYYFDKLKWPLLGMILLSFTSYIFKTFIDQNPAISFIYQTTFILSLLSVIGVMVYSFFMIFIRFYHSMFKDEGYFTHTLPISKVRILLAKILAAFSEFGVVVLIGLGMFFMIDLLNLEALKLLYETDQVAFNFMLITLGTGFLSLLTIILVLFAAMAIGFSFNQREWLYVFIIFMVYYLINQVLGLLNYGVYYLFNPNLIEEMSDPNTILNSLIPIIMTSFVISVIEGVIAFFVAKHYLEHKLNLKNG